MEFLGLINKLKHLPRKGWVIAGVKNPETVGCHMYRMAMATFLIKDLEASDKDRVMKMSLVHDLCESIVGDITPHDGIAKEEKQRLESEAMDQICNLVPTISGKEIRELWDEYEAAETRHAQYTKDLDKYDMILQAFEYEKEQSLDLSQFFNGIQFYTDEVQGWASELLNQRNNV